MHLISCDDCGVVVDISKTGVPPLCDEEGDIIDGHAVWEDRRWKVAIKCPVCGKLTAVT